MDTENAERNVQARLSKLKSTALHSAISDGGLSHEEHELVKHIKQALPKLKNMTTEIFEDGKVHAQEIYLFQELLKDLLDEVIEIAQSDRNLEYGEKVIIKQLRDQMIKLLKYMKSLQ